MPSVAPDVQFLGSNRLVATFNLLREQVTIRANVYVS